MSVPIVLASSSKYRREILERLGLDFEVVAPQIDETLHSSETAEHAVRRLAEEKARAVGLQFNNGLIIGSDQLSEQNGQIVGKPRDHGHAIEQLKWASGSKATLHSAVAVLNCASGDIHSQVVQVDVVSSMFTTGWMIVLRVLIPQI